MTNLRLQPRLAGDNMFECNYLVMTYLERIFIDIKPEV